MIFLQLIKALSISLTLYNDLGVGKLTPIEWTQSILTKLN